MTTFVLIHGGWHGGWCWRLVVDQLRAHGHRVFAPTLTGLGERRHLLSRDLTLDTHIADVANIFEMEELTDVVMVGHSYGGIIITGVADRMPGRIRHLVFLDALILENGQSAFDMLPADIVATRRKLVIEQGGGVAIPPPPAPVLGIPADHPQAAWVARHLTPHPAGTYESPLTLANPVGNGRPCTYVVCTGADFPSVVYARKWFERQAGWRRREIATGHDAMVTAPAELAAMLDAID